MSICADCCHDKTCQGNETTTDPCPKFVMEINGLTETEVDELIYSLNQAKPLSHTIEILRTIRLQNTPINNAIVMLIKHGITLTSIENWYAQKISKIVKR